MKNNKGFTLAELLIVVAIISVMVGISIPVFTAQLEKAKEAKDLSNVRSAYAELMINVITEDETATYGNEVIYKGSGTYSLNVSLSQAKDGWENHDEKNIAGVSSLDSTHWIGIPQANGKCKIEYKTDLDEVFLYWSGVGSISGDIGGNSGNGIPENNPGYIPNGPSGGSNSNNQNSVLSGVEVIDTANYSGLYEYGKVYLYDGNYIVVADATPQSNLGYCYQQIININKEPHTKDTCKNGTTYLETGDLYKDGDDLYVRIGYSGEWFQLPHESLSNWIKIN